MTSTSSGRVDRRRRWRSRARRTGRRTPSVVRLAAAGPEVGGRSRPAPAVCRRDTGTTLTQAPSRVAWLGPARQRQRHRRDEPVEELGHRPGDQEVGRYVAIRAAACRRRGPTREPHCRRHAGLGVHPWASHMPTITSGSDKNADMRGAGNVWKPVRAADGLPRGVQCGGAAQVTNLVTGQSCARRDSTL